MYYIGICDDDPAFIKYLERLISNMPEEITFYEYLSGEALLSDMQLRESYDLLVLDVSMPGIDGNKAAREFRKQYPDTTLVFCSGVFLPTVESFETTPYRYWLKEYTEEHMRQEIEEVFHKMKRNKVLPYLIGKKDNTLVKLSPNQISYISIAKRGTHLHSANSDELYASAKKLSEFYEQLKDFGFAYAHNSYIVNLRHIAVLSSKELEFINGEKLSISRSRVKELKEVFAIHLAKKYER